MTTHVTEYKEISSSGIKLLGIMVLFAQLPLLPHLPLWLSACALAVVAIRLASRSDKPLISNPIATGTVTLLGAIGIISYYELLLDREPCVAFLFLLVGCKYAETRRQPDAWLLILLSAFLLLTQFFYSQSIAAAAITIPALLFVGLSLVLVQRHPLAWQPRAAVRLTSHLFLQAIPLAIVLFLAVPRANTTGWGDGASATTGLSDRMSIGSVSELIASSEVAMRVEFNGPIPTPSQRYWRGPVLTGYDGINWFTLPSPVLESSPTALAKSASESALEYTVTISASHQRWLPMLDVPTDSPQQANTNRPVGQLNHERVAMAAKAVSRDLRYRAHSRVDDHYTPSDHPGSEYLLTTGNNPKSREFASKLRTNHTSDSEFIATLLKRFHLQDYHYTLRPQALEGADTIDEFMFRTREGFCEYYSSSFVFILRAAGIPARVVTGYQGGEVNGNYLIVRQSDAHAWAEAFVDGAWQRYDPTAAVAPQRVEHGIDAITNPNAENTLLAKLWPKSLALKWDQINYSWQRLIIDFDLQSQRLLWRWLGIDSIKGWMIASFFFLVLLIATMLFTNAGGIFSRRSPHAAIERQWRLFEAQFARHGYPQNRGETAKQYVQRLVQLSPNLSDPLAQLLVHYTQSTYGLQPKANKGQLRHHAKAMSRARKEVQAVQI